MGGRHSRSRSPPHRRKRAKHSHHETAGSSRDSHHHRHHHREKDAYRDRDRDRDKDRERGKDKDKEKDKERDRDRGRDKDRDRDKDKDRDRDRGRERYLDGDRPRERGGGGGGGGGSGGGGGADRRNRDRDGSRERDREKHSDKAGRSRHSERRPFPENLPGSPAGSPARSSGASPPRALSTPPAAPASAAPADQHGEAETSVVAARHPSTPAAAAAADQEPPAPPKTPAAADGKPDGSAPAVPSAGGTTPASAAGATGGQSAESEKVRLRREKLELWKRKKAEEGKAKQAASAAAAAAAATASVVAGRNLDPGGKEKTDAAVSPSPKAAASAFGGSGTQQKRPAAMGAFGAVKSKTTAQMKPKSGRFGIPAAEDDEAISKELKMIDMLANQRSGEGPATGLSSSVGGGSKMVIDKVWSQPVAEEEDEVDTLDAFMVDVTAEVKVLDEQDLKKLKASAAESIVSAAAAAATDDADDDFAEKPAEGDDEDKVGDTPEEILALAAKRLAAKKKDLADVDHSKVEYETFRRDFYVEPPELLELTPDDVNIMRAEMGIKIRGANCPKPVRKWTHCGLPPGCLEIIKRLGYAGPTPIQSQAIPAVMNGRDVIGVAKTGSGKTIAFLLPMFRHIKDQRPLEAMEGPIGIVMTPTRELAVQIHKECKNFLKVLGLRAVCAYGGSAIKDQIADLKRGAEIIICTPGRLIDLLCANSGRVTNLRRVTYLVLDEADRMFDMGFEPQVMKILKNVRPQRQTVLFSATFPKQMEALARKVLRRPLEITVGGRSVVCEDVKQIVEVREDATKFVRLLEILGNYFMEDKEGKALIFVDRQEAADNLLRDLIRRSYLCMSLHGGKDQTDRESTISDFKSGVTQIVIATSVAARGLDVKGLGLVINYECPNHLEDYVHRVGRTGRAGQKGTAYTFVTPDQDRYAVEVAKALKISGQDVPPDLAALVTGFQEKVKSGQVKFFGSGGFGGKGLEQLDKERDLVKQVQKKTYGDDAEEASEDEEGAKAAKNAEVDAKAKTPAETKEKAEGPHDNGPASPGKPPATPKTPVNAALAQAQAAAAAIQLKAANPAAAKAQSLIAELNAQIASAGVGTGKGKEGKLVPGTSPYSYEFEINDYPQKARWKATNKENISQVIESTGAAITTRGIYVEPGKPIPPGERKLYLIIEGEEQEIVDRAKAEIKRILTEATVSAMEQEVKTGGRYSVV